MAKRAVVLHPEAVAEARAAFEWYQVRSEMAASGFMAEIDVAIEHIAESPTQWSAYFAGTHRYLLQRFPYAVIYREVGNTVQVIAFAHGRRRPGYWKDRG